MRDSFSLYDVFEIEIRKERTPVEPSFSGTQQTPNKNQLPKVIRIVVCDKQSLAEDGLSLAVRNGRIEIRSRISHEVLHNLKISAE
jgi:hypothetical protein